MAFKNEPRIVNADEKIEWSHQPLTFEHYGIHVKIRENGRVIISKVADEQPDKDEVQYDEIDVPASLIFKIVGALKITRTAKMVPVTNGETEET